MDGNAVIKIEPEPEVKMDGSAVIKIEPEVVVVAERRSNRLRRPAFRMTDEDNYEVTPAGPIDIDPRKRIKNPLLLEKVNQFLRDIGTDPDDINFEEMEADWTYYEPKMAQDTENVANEEEEYYKPLPEGSVIVKIENEDDDTEQPHVDVENVDDDESNEAEIVDDNSVVVNLEVEADAKQQNGSEVLDVVVNSDNTDAEQQARNGPRMLDPPIVWKINDLNDFDKLQPDVDINNIEYVRY